MHPSSLSLYKQTLVTYFVGLLSGFSWAPFGWWFLGIAGLSYLFYLEQKLSLGQYLVVSSAFFFGVHSVAHAWVASAFYLDMQFSLIASVCLFLCLLVCLVVFSARRGLLASQAIQTQ
jgi:apolipoprotein N-acyltransferase